jgi:C-terminal processing protease CtpA/Prc
VNEFLAVFLVLCVLPGGVLCAEPRPDLNDEEAAKLGEEFGIVVGPVDDEVVKELKLERAEGVVVYEVIGGTPAELAGIKVRAIIKEIDKIEVRTMKDFGRALQRAIPQGNFTVGTYEPADAEVQGVGGLVNFHFVRVLKD